MTRLLLASASAARLRTLQAAGVEPVIRPSGVDEDAILAEAAAANGPVEPADAAMLLARAKAEAVAAHVVDATGLPEITGFEIAFVMSAAGMALAFLATLAIPRRLPYSPGRRAEAGGADAVSVKQAAA